MSDVVVIGGGPAGSTVAALVAEKGHDVLLLERGKEGDFKIGESLMPATYSTFQRLGVLDRLKASAFPRKHSVQFFAQSGKASAPFYFSENDPGESAVTWQVLRSEFDAMLRENAREKGPTSHWVPMFKRWCWKDKPPSACGRGCPTANCGRFPPGSWWTPAAKAPCCRGKLKIKKVEPELKKASIYTHFEAGYAIPASTRGRR